MKQLLTIILTAITISTIGQEKSRVIKGAVRDENGMPISFATIIIKGTRIGNKADANGLFTLRASKGDILQFSATNYSTKEINVDSSDIINAVLFKTSMLTEVVVTTALNRSKKSSISYSAASVHASNLSTSLAGKAAGLQVSSASPGSSTNIRLREQSSAVFGYRTDTMDYDTEGYDKIVENSFLKVTDNPLSTFSIDVDAASYSNIRRFINAKQLPPPGAVRIEEMINYFSYEYPQPQSDDPFSINTEITTAPWNNRHKLVLIGLQGKKIPEQNLPPCNLVFLIDVSGSMMDMNKLPLVKYSMKMLVDQLRPQDKVAIVVYAGAAGLVLNSTSGKEKIKIKDAIDNLEAGGSTAGGAGIQLAYQTALNNFMKDGNNRVILCTDGDFNVGESSDDAMERLIEDKRKSGVFLTVLGYGTGNYQDSKMQKLADKGNGNHAYIDGAGEAKKVLINEFGGTLFTIAKDVKLQVEFNPLKVQAYRLIGYENRMLAKEDFNDDKKDAGDMGSGHTVTALYEVIPAGIKSEFTKTVDTLKYQDNMIAFSKSAQTDELLTVKFRYKQPAGDSSKLLEQPVKDRQVSIENASANLQFSAAVAQFGMLLINSQYKSSASYGNILSLARKAKGNDTEGYRSEFISLVKAARSISPTIQEEAEDNEEGK